MAVELDKLLRLAIDKKAAELRFSVDAPPSVLLHGSLRPLNLPPLSPDDTLRYMRAIAPERCKQEFKDKGTCEFGLAFEEKAHFFVTVSMQRGHCDLRLRWIPKHRRVLDDEDT